ncbi:MAG: DNA-binding protein, partial [Marinobacterium sp.]
MKQWFTAKEFADAKLPGLPSTESGMVRRIQREGWEGQQRMGKGGGYEYHISNLPYEARKALEAQIAGDMLTRICELPRQLAPVTATLSNVPMTHRQRAAADARATIINAINEMCSQGVTQTAALTTLLTQAGTGQLQALNPVLDKALQMAKDSRGRSNGTPYPSVRSLKRYLGK